MFINAANHRPEVLAEQLRSGHPSFVLFKMDGCPHCDDMALEFKKFSDSNRSTGVKVFLVQAGDKKATALFKRFGMTARGFPSMFVRPRGAMSFVPYRGPRTAAGMQASLKVGPPKRKNKEGPTRLVVRPSVDDYEIGNPMRNIMFMREVMGVYSRPMN